jgi:hypothetical protein
MKRKQIYIEEEQEAWLKEVARTRGVAEAVVIREAIHEYLVTKAPDAMTPALNSMSDHPLSRIIGIGSNPDAPTDGSLNHDHYLYGGPKKWRLTKSGKAVRNWPRERRVR